MPAPNDQKLTRSIEKSILKIVEGQDYRRVVCKEVADQYGVSDATVRRILERLVVDRVLVPSETRRLWFRRSENIPKGIFRRSGYLFENDAEILIRHVRSLEKRLAAMEELISRTNQKTDACRAL